MSPRAVFLLGLLVVVLPPALQLYLLMPFPGSQEHDSIRLAYTLHRLQATARVAGVGLAVAGAALLLKARPGRRRVAFVAVAGALAIAALYAVHHFSAEGIFLPPERLGFAATPPASLPPETLVLGVVMGERARAYPIRLLAYHHLVLDEIEGQPLLPTY